MRKRVKFIFTLLLMLSTFWAGQVLAYTVIGYQLVGGVYDRTFYINDETGGVFTSHIRNAVSYWNASPTKVNYNETSATNATLVFWAGDPGNVDWYGFTYYLDQNGGFINYGGYPNKNWYSNQVKLNSDQTGATFTKQALAGHEMGHAVGLMHSSVSTALMHIPYVVETPQKDDTDGVNSIYGY